MSTATRTPDDTQSFTADELEFLRIRAGTRDSTQMALQVTCKLAELTEEQARDLAFEHFVPWSKLRELWRESWGSRQPPRHAQSVT